MAMKRKFPVSRLRNVLKQNNSSLKFAGPKVSYLIYLDYVLFLQRLATEATNVQRQEKANRLKPAHVVKARKVLKLVYNGSGRDTPENTHNSNALSGSSSKCPVCGGQFRDTSSCTESAQHVSRVMRQDKHTSR